MTNLKFRTKSLVLTKDLEHSQKLGIPVEVFSIKGHQTVAFGRIQLITTDTVMINNQCFARDIHAFFGCPCPL